MIPTNRMGAFSRSVEKLGDGRAPGRCAFAAGWIHLRAGVFTYGRVYISDGRVDSLTGGCIQ
eukprot:508990-Prorocentrum_minimum.AAC.1